MAVNDILELWSLPWHALQRSLAKGFGSDSALVGREPAGVKVKVSEATSWLVRARAALPDSHGRQVGR
jgi:hypothetical protein